MAIRRLGAWFAAVALTLGIIQFAPAVRAQSQGQEPAAQQPTDDAQAKTFVGQIVQARDGRFALLTDKQAGKGYFLDDQVKAKKFNGQTVKVTGTLDVRASLIHVTDIQPA